MTANKWHNVSRVVHLQGGIRAISNPGNEVVIIPGPDNKPNKKFNISRYPELIRNLEKQGLKVVGIDFYETEKQLKGHSPPNWRSVYANPSKNYPAWEAEDIWSCLANAGFEKGNIEFADICTLRDYIAEFIASYILHKYFPNSNIRIKTMSGLRKKILPIASKDTVFAKELYDITDENSNDPWLIRLGAYRNLVVHFVPLIDATHRGFLVQKILRSKIAENYPSIFFPIPPNPIKMENLRTKGLAFSTVDEWLKASTNYDCDKDAALDALDYCSE